MATGDPDFCLMHKQPLHDCGDLHDPASGPTPLNEAWENFEAATTALRGGLVSSRTTSAKMIQLREAKHEARAAVETAAKAEAVKPWIAWAEQINRHYGRSDFIDFDPGLAADASQRIEKARTS